ncbi:MAG: discoidin domain-containing protein [Thermodesulfobacteriota bacterium]
MLEKSLTGTSMPAGGDPRIETSETLGGAGKTWMRFFSRFGRKAGQYTWRLTKKGGYYLFVVVAVIVVLVGLDAAAKIALNKSHMADVYPQDISMAKRDLTRPVSHYDYDLNPGVCLIYNQPKGNRYEYANNAGFRDHRSISLEKPDDEFRIFLTGGSTAFGLGAAGQAAAASNFYYLEHRETIAYMLEKILNLTTLVPGKKVRVYNTAVWGYSYQHLLMRYLTKLRLYKPDFIVSLDGANEIHPVSIPENHWNYFEHGQFHGILKEIFAYNKTGLSAYVTLWLKNNSFLMTLFWRGTDPFFAMEVGMRMHQATADAQGDQATEVRMSAEDRSRMVAQNILAVTRVVENYHSVLENDGVPHIFALQPMLYLSKKPRHEMEQKVESLEEHKQYYDVPTDRAYKFMVDRIAESAQRKQYFVADFTEYFNDTSEWVFTDWCHLTAGANYLIAKELANIIKESFFRISPTEGDQITGTKDSFFWNPLVKANVVFAPPAEEENSGPTNILTGYPGPAVYASKEVPEGEPFELILDLNQEFTLSRLRLVWDDGSVPEEWSVDISPDGETWKPWIKGDNKELDEFSWWPGYEYYGADPVQARYLRYRPVKSEVRTIKLRSWSVYR